MRKRWWIAIALGAMTIAKGIEAKMSEIPDSWAAVGLLTYQWTEKSGGSRCTATLVAPDLILTADHCIRGSNGEPIDPTMIRFTADWRSGKGRIFAVGAAILASGGGIAPQQDQKDWTRDLALVRLDRSIKSVAPLPLAGADPGLPPWKLMAFSGGMGDVPQFADCSPVAIKRPFIGVDCPVVSGNSGAPLLAEVDGTWRILAVMVARNLGNPGSWKGLALVPPKATRMFLADVPWRRLKSEPPRGMGLPPDM